MIFQIIVFSNDVSCQRYIMLQHLSDMYLYRSIFNCCGTVCTITLSKNSELRSMEKDEIKMKSLDILDSKKKCKAKGQQMSSKEAPLSIHFPCSDTN